jgi:hypothetical protein
MSKLTKDLFGQPDGEFMPRVIPAGEECPPELIEAARDLGALGDGDAPRPRTKARRGAPENKGT